MRGGRYAKCTYHSSDSTYDKLGRPRRRTLRNRTAVISNTICQAGAAGGGWMPFCIWFWKAGRQKCPARTRTPTPSNLGNLLRLGKSWQWQRHVLWGQKHGASGPVSVLDADRPAFCFFSAVANQSCAHQHRIQSAAGQLTNKKHRDRLVRKEEKPTPSKPLRL